MFHQSFWYYVHNSVSSALSDFCHSRPVVLCVLESEVILNIQGWDFFFNVIIWYNCINLFMHHGWEENCPRNLFPSILINYLEFSSFHQILLNLILHFASQLNLLFHLINFFCSSPVHTLRVYWQYKYCIVSETKPEPIKK